jgi:hypothetical protein
MHAAESTLSRSARFAMTPEPLHARRFAVDRDEEFLALLAAFRSSGGLATGAELVLRQPDTGTAQLARWIIQREVMSFEWQGHLWLPAFQFERGRLACVPAVQRVVRELPHTLGGWDLAPWWVEPNALLADGSPLDRLDQDTDGVVQAARAFRFIAAG